MQPGNETAPPLLAESGPWRLSDELRTAGTVPQVASGRRLCSIRAKGEPLDAWMDTHLTGPFNHVLGFNADEIRTAQRDVSYARPGRHSRYPLIEWGWDRATCEDYVADTVGEPWSRSCCTYCPFAGSAGGIDDLIERYRRHPDAALDALLLEHTARALNPQMRLFGARALSDELRPVWPEILARFADHLDTRPWSLYRIRRIVHATRSDPARKGPAWRSVITLATGPADSIRAQLHRHATSVGCPR